MSIRRVVPNLCTTRLDESRAFYVDLLGFTVAMDMGSMLTFASPSNPTAQLSVMAGTGASPPHPDVTVEVADVDAVHARAVARGQPIAYPLTDEPWGVRRFFLVDPNGVVLNVMTHRPAT